MGDNDFASSAPEPKIATCDQEVWVQNQIKLAMRMAIAMKKETRVDADRDALRYGMEGVAEGVAREIIHTLGMRPEYTNIRNLNLPSSPIPIRNADSSEV